MMPERKKWRIYTAKTLMIVMILLGLLFLMENLTTGKDDSYWGTHLSLIACIMGCITGLVIFQLKKSYYTLIFCLGYTITTICIILLYVFGALFLIKRNHEKRDIDGDFEVFFYVQMMFMLIMNIFICITSWYGHKDLSKWNWEAEGVKMAHDEIRKQQMMQAMMQQNMMNAIAAQNGHMGASQANLIGQQPYMNQQQMMQSQMLANQQFQASQRQFMPNQQMQSGYIPTQEEMLATQAADEQQGIKMNKAEMLRSQKYQQQRSGNY